VLLISLYGRDRVCVRVLRILCTHLGLRIEGHVLAVNMTRSVSVCPDAGWDVCCQKMEFW